jgi:hypothetical protein
VLTRCLPPWLRSTFAGRYDPRPEQYLSAAGLRPVWRRSYLRDSVVALVLESA